MKRFLGYIVGGSLGEGLTMRLHHEASLDDVKNGKFVCVISHKITFFSLVTDLILAVTHPDILLFPPTARERLLSHITATKDLYTTILLRPMLMMEQGKIPTPVKTVPHHFAEVYTATARDVAAIFGDEHDSSQRYFTIGTPLDMVTPVCLDLERLAERNSGIFGKTGTGKTFLTRLVLAGTIKQEKAINLVFDMHSEYGLQARKEGSDTFVKGLKTLFPERVALFSLDPISTRRRGINPDIDVVIPVQTLTVEDMLALQDEFNFHATALEVAYLLYARYKAEWLITLFNHGTTLKELAEEIGAHPESLAALYRKLKRIESLPFFSFVRGSNSHQCVIERMLEYIDRGIHVIVEFGNYTSSFVYLLIANIITRRIHTQYVTKTEKFLASHRKDDEPKKLIITIEEAHKFLNPSAARQTIFGTIAREMRKYYVSLLVVDQRPSGIDEEILSQIGTKIVAQLTDDKDISAVLTGINSGTTLRSVLATLDTKKQALILGHAVAMPIVIQTREYNEDFYRAMGQVTVQQINDYIKELF